MAMIISSPMEPLLYSVRMRASSQGRHLAGAERIVPVESIDRVIAALVGRAINCNGGPAREVNCSLEQIDSARICHAGLPDIATFQVETWREGRQAAISLLTRAGVRTDVADSAVALLANGAGPGGSVMRGAVLMDFQTGERLESDPSRGVRVSRMDLTPAFRPQLKQHLDAVNLGHPRVLEALVLAGKVLQAPGMVAELCWSDDPGYTTGYVADPRFGYQRITALKPGGDPRGGRVFFVRMDETSPAELIDFLETQPVLFNAAGSISSTVKWTPDHA